MRRRSLGELRDSARALEGRMELDQIYVLRCELETFDRTQESPFTTDTGFELTGTRVGDTIEAHAVFVTQASKVHPDAADDPTLIWSVEVECVGIFEGEGLDEFTDDEVEAFAVVVGAPAIHPYVRELTQSLSGRTQYPAFTMGLMKTLTDLPADFEIEFSDQSVPSPGDP